LWTVVSGQNGRPLPGDPLPGINAAELEEFTLGLDDFTEVESVEEGRGPARHSTARAAPCATACRPSAAPAWLPRCGLHGATSAASSWTWRRHPDRCSRSFRSRR